MHNMDMDPDMMVEKDTMPASFCPTESLVS